LAFHLALTLLKIAAVKRTKLLIARLIFSILCLSALSISTTLGDDTRAGAAAPKPVNDATEPKKEAPEPKKESAEPAKEDAEAKLLKLFQEEKPITNSLGTVMVWLPAGYRVAQYEVTQAQYEQIMKDNPSKFPGPQYPVDSVTLSEASQFCKKLTDGEIEDHKLPKGYSYSLPSEQQWEYYVDEADLKQAVTSYYGDRKNPESVGLFPPNQFELYDTRGNVWDLCNDNVARGGSWRSYDDYVFIQFRYVAEPDKRYDDVGFRVVLQGESGVVQQSAPSPGK